MPARPGERGGLPDGAARRHQRRAAIVGPLGALALAVMAATWMTDPDRRAARRSPPTTAPTPAGGPGAGAEGSATTSTTAGEPAQSADRPQPTPTSTGWDGGVEIVAVVDGDTLTVADGVRVRLAQVDAPETTECFGPQATAALRAATAGRTVELRRPPDGPATDPHGRTLADVRVGGASVNEWLVRDGAAEWYEDYADEDVELARRLQAAEQEARAAGRGLWSACPLAGRPAGSAAVAGGPSPPTTSAPGVGGGGGPCDPAYPDVCIPPPPPDLDCGDIPQRRFRVLPPDPHRFDDGRDDDGLGCERG